MKNIYVFPLKSFVVHDGDTVDVDLDLGFDITFHIALRIFGVDCPELNTSAGKKVRDILTESLAMMRDRGIALHVSSNEWDKYGGRVVGDILLGLSQTPISSRLLLLKLAQPYTGDVKKTPWTDAERARVTALDAHATALALFA